MSFQKYLLIICHYDSRKNANQNFSSVYQQEKWEKYVRFTAKLHSILFSIVRNSYQHFPGAESHSSYYFMFQAFRKEYFGCILSIWQGYSWLQVMSGMWSECEFEIESGSRHWHSHYVGFRLILSSEQSQGKQQDQVKYCQNKNILQRGNAS